MKTEKKRISRTEAKQQFDSNGNLVFKHSSYESNDKVKNIQDIKTSADYVAWLVEQY